MSEYKNDGVDHPPHYNAHPTGIECIDVVEHFGFNIGNAMKYLWRAGLKPGEDMIKDLEKACWYVQREIKRLQVLPDRRKKKDAVIESALVSWAKRAAEPPLPPPPPKPTPIQQQQMPPQYSDCCGAESASESCGKCDENYDKAWAEYETLQQKTDFAGVKHRRNNWGPIPPDPKCASGYDTLFGIPIVGVIGENVPDDISDIKIADEVAKEPAKKPNAEPSGTSEEDTATTVDPIAEKSAVVYSKSPQKPCKDCGAPYDRSDWHRFKGICAVCRKMQRDKALAEKIAMLNEADVRIGPDRNKPEPPKETLNKIISADYLLKRLKHDYPARGEFLVEDAMRITEMPFRDTLQLLQLIGEDRVKAISPAELKSQQKWKLVKETKNATN